MSIRNNGALAHQASKRLESSRQERLLWDFPGFCGRDPARLSKIFAISLHAYLWVDFRPVVRICTVVQIYSRRHRGQLLRPASVGAWASLAHIRLLSRNVVHFLFAQRAELFDSAEKSIVAKVKRRSSDRGCVLACNALACRCIHLRGCCPAKSGH